MARLLVVQFRWVDSKSLAVMERRPNILVNAGADVDCTSAGVNGHCIRTQVRFPSQVSLRIELTHWSRSATRRSYERPGTGFNESPPPCFSAHPIDLIISGGRDDPSKEKHQSVKHSSERQDYHSCNGEMGNDIIREQWNKNTQWNVMRNLVKSIKRTVIKQSLIQISKNTETFSSWLRM